MWTRASYLQRILDGSAIGTLHFAESCWFNSVLGAKKEKNMPPTIVEETTVVGRLLEPAGWRLSWGAVLAGVIVALVVHILLNLLGLGIGAVTAEPAARPDGETVENVGILAGLWWSASGIVAAGLGGWFAGRSMGSADRDDGAIHGLLSWAATTLIVAFFLTSVLGGALAGALGNLDFNRVAATSPAPSAQAPTEPANQQTSPADAAAEAAAKTTPAQRETARDAIATSALASFFALVLGAVAAAFGGRWGVTAAREALKDD
jgi:hypothetical protein